MEKKTMGSFISALRRAAGMTQRELGERLFVSDKTVSRWERDECTPDLSLIPMIADLFGVTADELLRGERNGAANVSDGEADKSEPSAHQKQKSDRAFRALLERRMVQFKNRSLISVGVALLGVIVAAIINLGFLRAQIAFWTSLCFLIGSVICQRCFCVSAWMTVDEEQEMSEAQMQAVNAFNCQCMMITQREVRRAACLFAFCLPLGLMVSDAYRGLSLASWMLYGTVYAAVAFIFSYSVWELFVRRALVQRGALVMSEQGKLCYAAERRLLGRSLGVLVAVGAVVLAAVTVLQSIDVSHFSRSYVLSTREEFVAFAEAEEPYDNILVYKDWFVDVHQSVVDQAPNSNINAEQVLPPEGDEYLQADFHGRDGEVLFRYTDRQGIARIGLSDTEDGFPVRVYTRGQISAGYRLRDGVGDALGLAYGIFGAVVIAVYVKKLRTLREKHRE